MLGLKSSSPNVALSQKRSWRIERSCHRVKSQTDGTKGIVRRGTASGKTGKELREEYFLAAQTGKERGLPEGAFLNDNTTGAEPQTEITWEPYGDKCSASQGSNILRAGVEAGAFVIGPQFCLTGQCDSCMVELDTGEVKLGCLHSVPKGRADMQITVIGTDEAWDAMCADTDDDEKEQEALSDGDGEDLLFV